MMTLIQHDERDVQDTSAHAGSGIERRRGLRIAQERPIKVFEPGTGRYYPGQTADVSATGLRVEMPFSAPVAPGSTLNVHVGLSQMGESLANRRSMIPARVVWIDRNSTACGRMMLGLEFVTSITAQSDAA